MISAAAQGLVLSWWDRHRRDLPWRDTRDPWAVLIAEIMAQQTQVNRVVPRWHEFLERWPTPAVLAAASLADVLRAWQGLGYPRRAANLHRSAQVVVADPGLGGSLPDTLEGLLALPGIGPYTARAVLAFAHEADVGVVDTNTGRILARVGGRRLGARAAQVAAGAWVRRVRDGRGTRRCSMWGRCCADRCPDATTALWPSRAAGRWTGGQTPIRPPSRRGCRCAKPHTGGRCARFAVVCWTCSPRVVPPPTT